MIKTKHIILGAGGAIGNVLAEELLARNEDVKLVGRGSHSRQGAESQQADLTKLGDITRAVEESSIVYLLAGLQYKYSIWQEQWPAIMQNTISACKTRNAKLIFFDNVYMYGKVDGVMTEETPFSPCSKKGEVRARIAGMLMSEIKAGNINGIIARSADFYGPFTEKSSVPFFLVIQKLAQDKKAQWLVNAKARHSFTYTGDCGKALYFLATTEDAANQVWHLPTTNPAITGEELIRIAAESLGKKPTYSVLSKWMIRMAGLINETIRESYEMLYQNEYDYIFDSTKFEKRFGFRPTPYRTGIKETINHFKQKGLI
jgi:nucleoside-diphosphate-sugar epimerase